MQARLEKILYNENEISKWVTDDGFCCYSAVDICKAVNVQRMRGFDLNEIVSDDQRTNYNITTYKEYKDTIRIDNKMLLLTELGLKRFLCSSRSIESVKLAKFLNIDTYSYKIPVKESKYINAIVKSLRGEKFIFQYVPAGTNYRIDAYMPEYNISIECDEKHHDANIAEDKIRQQDITNILNCSWVRFKPDDPNFDIFDVIGDVHSLLKK